METDLKREIRSKVKECVEAEKRNDISRDTLYTIAAVAMAMEITHGLNKKLTDKLERHGRIRR